MACCGRAAAPFFASGAAVPHRGRRPGPRATGDIWMLVLRGATSQSKRSRSDRRPIGPAASPPAHTAGIACSAVRIDSMSTVASSARMRGFVKLDQRLQEALRRAGDAITPALTNLAPLRRAARPARSRSHTCTARALEGLLDETTRRLQPCRQIAQIGPRVARAGRGNVAVSSSQSSGTPSTMRAITSAESRCAKRASASAIAASPGRSAHGP